MILMKATANKAGYFQRFQTFAINRIGSPSAMEKNSLLYWRARILFAMLFTGFLLAFLVVIPIIPFLQFGRSRDLQSRPIPSKNNGSDRRMHPPVWMGGYAFRQILRPAKIRKFRYLFRYSLHPHARHFGQPAAQIVETFL